MMHPFSADLVIFTRTERHAFLQMSLMKPLNERYPIKISEAHSAFACKKVLDVVKE